MRAPAPGTALEAEGLAVRLGRRTVLSGVDLVVPRGARVGVVGVNGSGKSTLLRALAGLVHPSRGAVRLAGPDGTLDDLHHVRDRARARRLAYVAQEEVPQAELLVGELVALGRVPGARPWSTGGRDEREAVLAALDAVGLADLVDTPCDRLSGGERRRAVLARGLAQDCPVLVLDEPTNHLDVAWQLRVLAHVTRRRPDRLDTLVASIHDLDLALRWFDTLVVLGAAPDGDGASTVVAVGPPAEVLTPALVLRHFGVAADQVDHPRLAQRHLLVHPADPTPKDAR